MAKNNLQTIAITFDQIKNKDVAEIIDWLYNHNIKYDVNPLYRQHLYDDELLLYREWCLMAVAGNEQLCLDADIVFHITATQNDLILFKTTWW